MKKLSTFLTYSCKKDKQPIIKTTPEPVVKMTMSPINESLVTLAPEGYLHFQSPEAFDKVMELLANNSDEQLDQWEKGLGFTSGYTYYEIKKHEETGKPGLYKNTKLLLGKILIISPEISNHVSVLFI